MHRLARQPLIVGVVALASFAVGGCGGGSGAGGTGPNPPGGGSGAPASIAVNAGDQQTARIRSAVASPPAVLVKDAAGRALAGAGVTFAVASGGGSITGGTVTTNAQGIAQVGGWTVGSAVGMNTVTATVTGLAPATFTATARAPYWTVAVYMAADNNLAESGVIDLEEMEAAAANPEVQVVVQGEFSPSQLAQDGISSPGQLHLPSWNTFRYDVSGAAGTPAVLGPNGAVTDLGNRNMTDPAELQGFVQWVRTTYPSQHLMLVLWNHGGGYQGLLADETSAPGVLMGVPQLHTALSSGKVDVLDFDMCLMGAYETLANVVGLTDFAVFSEEVVPGDGNDYTALLNGLGANPAVDGKAAANIVADRFAAFYTTSRASTTESVYDLSGFTAFETALDALAQSLTTGLPASSSLVASAALNSQRYHTSYLTDVGDLMDSLAAYTADPQLLARIAAVKQANTAFRLRNYPHNGGGAGTAAAPASVQRSQGMSILLPAPNDPLPVVGPLSLTGYQSAMPGKAWTNFLTALLNGTATQPIADQGVNRFEGYDVWSSNLATAQGDIDFWVLEPSGSLYIPYIGSVTPNGALTPDSYSSHTPVEGMFTNRFVEAGHYQFYAFLWTDPQNFRPLVDFAWRNNQSQPYSAVYGAGSQPQLSRDVSWLNDPAASFATIDAGSYTDIRYMAFVDFVATSSLVASQSAAMVHAMPLQSSAANRPSAAAASVGMAAMQMGGRPSPSLTQAQISRVRSLIGSGQYGQAKQSQRVAAAMRMGGLPAPHVARMPGGLPLVAQ